MSIRRFTSLLGALGVVCFLSALPLQAQGSSMGSPASQPPPQPPPRPVAALDLGVGKWVYSADSDEMTSKADERITLAADDSTSDRLGRKVLAELVLSCGSTFSKDSPRAMLFNAGIPMPAMHTIVADVAEIMLRTDSDNSPETKRVWVYDRGHTVVFIGGFGNPQFSGGFLKKLLRSKTLRVRYSPLVGDTNETVTFTLDGLPAALTRLTRCTWD